MPWFRKYFLQDENKDGAGGGGSGGGAGGAGGSGDGKGGQGGADHAAELASVKAANAALEARLAKLEGKGGGEGVGGGVPDPTLADKARLERETAEKKKGEEKRMESALQFGLTSKDWVKTNLALLPKTIEGIFSAADKENFASAIDKESAIKSEIISEFFGVQSNLDLLTASQKSALAEFKGLTKDKKQEKAQHVFDTIFEPTFENLKKVKRAEQIGKGHAEPSNSAEAYKEKLMKGSRKHFTGKDS